MGQRMVEQEYRRVGQLYSEMIGRELLKEGDAGGQYIYYIYCNIKVKTYIAIFNICDST